MRLCQRATIPVDCIHVKRDGTRLARLIEIRKKTHGERKEADSMNWKGARWVDRP